MGDVRNDDDDDDDDEYDDDDVNGDESARRPAAHDDGGPQSQLLDHLLDALLFALDVGAPTELCDHCEDLRALLAPMAQNYRRHLESHRESLSSRTLTGVRPLHAPPTPPPPPPPPVASERSMRVRDAPLAPGAHADAAAARAALERWFDRRLTSVRTRGRGDCISRRIFLKDYVNPVLTAAGLAPWTSRTPLYKHWFLPVLLRLSREDTATGAPWIMKWKGDMEGAGGNGANV